MLRPAPISVPSCRGPSKLRHLVQTDEPSRAVGGHRVQEATPKGAELLHAARMRQQTRPAPCARPQMTLCLIGVMRTANRASRQATLVRLSAQCGGPARLAGLRPGLGLL